MVLSESVELVVWFWYYIIVFLKEGIQTCETDVSKYF